MRNLAANTHPNAKQVWLKRLWGDIARPQHASDFQRQSHRGWRDLLGLAKVQADALDRNHPDHWSGQFVLTARLHRAFEEAALPK